MKSFEITLYAVIIYVSKLHGSPVGRNGDRIIGGTEAEPHEHPYIAAIHRFGGMTTYHWCGASIISDKWIMTAAHCIRASDNETTFRIVAGDHDVKVDEGTEQIRRVERIVRHENFSDAYAYVNDIALLKVQPPFVLNKFVQEAVLPSRSLDILPGILLMASGWGRLTPTGTLPDRLMHVEIPSLADEACQEVYGDLLLDSMLCAMDPTAAKDSCRGDTGGPLSYFSPEGVEVIVGITSWGLGCASPGFPGVYTEVSHYVDWIHSVVGRNSSF